jgi:short subunit dehydrogenase-like uncharacterized protein
MTYEIVVFGATGFTGRLIARYLAKQNVHFAIAGRSLAKLQSVKAEDKLPEHVALLQADSNDAAALREVLKQTKAMITTVGPYDSYGSVLYGEAAKAGVIYLDLTGEPLWMAAMLKKHTDDIKASGAIMLSSSGFDSVPSDLAVLLATKALQDQGHTVGRISGAAKVTGSVSGGTFQTGVIMSHKPKEVLKPVLKNQYCLSPVQGSMRRKMKLVEELDQGFGAIFPLGMHNERIVMRSWGLRELLGGQDLCRAWGDGFEYTESLQCDSRIKAYVVSSFVAFFGFLLSMSWSRALLARFGPQAGSGPKEEALSTGFFRLTANAQSKDGQAKASGTVLGNGDPARL